MGTLRFFEEVVSFKIRRTFGFADYIRIYGLSSHIEHKYDINCTNPRVLDDFCRKEAAKILGWIHYINGIEPVFAYKCFNELKKITNDDDIFYLENADSYINQRK